MLVLNYWDTGQQTKSPAPEKPGTNVHHFSERALLLDTFFQQSY
jgi:hypothetical protein